MEINIISEGGGRLKQIKEFKISICREGGTENIVSKRVQEAWRKLRMKIYKSAVKPMFFYGAETWSLMKKEEGPLERTEMRKVRWISEISLSKRRESNDIRRMCTLI